MPSTIATLAVKPPVYGILITSISKKVPLIKAVKVAAKKTKNFTRIYGSDSQNECIAKYEVDNFWHSPLIKNLDVNEVMAYCQKNDIKAIIPTRNEDLEFYSYYLEKFKSRGIGIMVSSLNVIENCLDKIKFARCLIQAGLPAIPTYSSIEINYTNYVVKTRRGAGGLQVKIGLSRKKAEMYAKKLQEPIFQPFIKGREWSVDLYRNMNGNVMGTVARQRNFIENGESLVTTTQSYPALEDLCKKISLTLNLYGHAVIQVIEDDTHHFHVVECNPRFGGASTASVAVGLDSFYWFLLESQNQNIDSLPFNRSSSEIRQVRHPADWIFPWS